MRLDIPTPASSSGYSTVKDEGTPLPQRTDIDFVGAGVTVTDVGGVTRVSVPGGAGASWSEIEVDFGSVAPKYDAEFNITDAAVSPSSVIIILESGKTASGRADGDAQWDAISAVAKPGAGSFVVYCMAHPGPVAGKRKLQYQVN